MHKLIKVLHFEIIYRYEAVFYGALALALFGWILFENSLLYLKKSNTSLASFEAENGNILLEEGDRCLQLSDMRIPIVFVSRINIYTMLHKWSFYFTISYYFSPYLFLLMRIVPGPCKTTYIYNKKKKENR